MASHFPELGAPIGTAPGLGDGKKLVDVDPLYPDRLTAQCYPRLIFFPEIVAQKHSQIKPMDETNAMLSLIQHSAGIAADRDPVARHLEVLKLLVHQARTDG